MRAARSGSVAHPKRRFPLRTRLWLGVTVVLPALACSGVDETVPAATPEVADLILLAGTVHRMDGTPTGAALAILGSRILAVSTKDGILRYRGGKTRIESFAGGHVYPGLQDPHGHLLALGREEPIEGDTECEELQRGLPGTGTADPGAVEAALLRAQTIYLRCGITRVHEVSVLPAVQHGLRRLAAAGRWRLGVCGVLPAPGGEIVDVRALLRFVGSRDPPRPPGAHGKEPCWRASPFELLRLHGDPPAARRRALAAITREAAWGANEEHVRGVIRPGFEADLTVVDRDLLDVPAEALRTTRVLATVVAGEIVFRLAAGGG